MQSDIKTIYKLTSERTGKPEQLYKEVGSFILKEVYEQLHRPTHLILRLKGVGFWYLRKGRMEKAVNNKAMQNSESENFKAMLRIFHERLEDYQRYLAKKQETKRRRHEFENLPKGPQESPQPSQD